MTELAARNEAEAYLYLELRATEGEGRTEHSRSTEFEPYPQGGPGATRMRCALPGEEYVFVLPAPPYAQDHRPDAVDYGPGRSTLLDPLDWFTVEAGYAQGGAGAVRALAESGETPGERESAAVSRMLRIAAGAADQLARYLPEGGSPGDAVPAGAFLTQEGRDLRSADSWPFERGRIDQARADYRALLAEFLDGTGGRPA
ncbi:hypothetical protein AB0J21_04775 [Streptomyces sp. NPDC049954]|uniref:hypothetical protein n=1 Tax=Streptomyces sp. NPDC049954 TaxID=3155779 RepID=UPI003446BA69